jgi:hypothetical protein
MRAALISFVTFVSGLYFFLEWLLPEKVAGYEFAAYHEQISNAFITISVMAIGLGLINIVRVHGSAVVRRRKGYLNSIALFMGMLLMFVVEGGDLVKSFPQVNSWTKFNQLEAFSKKLYQEKASQDKVALIVSTLAGYRSEMNDPNSFLSLVSIEPSLAKTATESFESLTFSANYLAAQYKITDNSGEVIAKAHYDFEQQAKQFAQIAHDVADKNFALDSSQKLKNLLREGFFFPLGSAMFSLLAFYIAVAAYRSFRIKSLEAFIMMAFAVIVMLGQIPQGPELIYEKLPELRLWILDNISTPAFRAISFGATIAGLSMSIRMWLSLERSPLADENS